MIRSHRYLEKAFALPTILIASVVMIIVMLAAIQSVVSIRIALDNQYYDKLAQEAGESGTVMATNCIKQNDSTGWALPLKPGTDCNGAGTASYVLNSANVRTSFSVPTPTIGADGVVTLNVQSTVELLRTSNSLPWKTYTQTTAASILTNSFDISSGNDTTCATVNGKLYCWGYNNLGQVGNGNQTDQLKPFNVNSGALAGKYVYQGTSGFNHTCAVAGPGPAPAIGTSKVYCWGDNALAQMGIGTVGGGPYLTPIAAATSLPTDRAYKSISGSYNTCVLGTNVSSLSSVWCWAENGSGQSGDNFTNTPKKTPTENGTITADSGAVRFIVDNSTTDSTANSTTLTTATKINHVNSSIGCALTTDNKIYCWGSNASGGMGTGVLNNTTVNKRWRARIAGAAGVAATTSNYRFSDFATNFGRICAIGKTSTTSVDGKIYCWGTNGDDTTAVIDYRTSSKETAYQWADVRSLITAGAYTTATFKAIALSDWDICAIRSDGIYNGKVFCWGYNNFGQLGNGTTSAYTPTPGVTPDAADKPISPEAMVQVTGELSNKTVVKITSGNDHFCAMTVTGASYCWGRNDHGQLGDGTTTSRSTPVRTGVPITVTLF